MSVLAVNRSETKFEAIVNADKLYNMLTDLAERNFGIKDMNVFVRKQNSQGASLRENVAKFRYFIDSTTKRVELFASNLTSDVRAARAIFPTSMSEYEKRRAYLDQAIVDCELITNELQKAVNKLDVDVNFYATYIKAIDREIELIKRWRQRDNKFKDKLQGNV